MPNDTTTLNGALKELGETMAANLTTQGVPSTYDEGLTTLAGKILDIQGGGGTRTLTLTADKSILSYYDSDTATLSATLLEDGEPVTGETVEFWSGSVSLGTSVTNSSGVAEKVYSSTGSGDVELSASVGTLSSETYELQDCPFSDLMTSASGHWNIPSSVSDQSIFGYSNEGWKFGNASSYTSMLCDYVPTAPFICQFTITEVYRTGLTLIFGSQYISSRTDGSTLTISDTTVGTISLNQEYTAKVYSDKVDLYLGDTLVGSKSAPLGTPKLALDTGSSRYLRIKNFKIKPL